MEAALFALFDEKPSVDVKMNFHWQGTTNYRNWYPKNVFTSAKSPYMYLSEFQVYHLLHRSAPISAVVQKRGKTIIRVYVINSGLWEVDTGLLDWVVTGLFKYKVILINSVCEVICDY